jgi:hypothetical protein
MIGHDTIAKDTARSAKLCEFLEEEAIVGARWKGQSVIESSIVEVVDFVRFKIHGRMVC